MNAIHSRPKAYRDIYRARPVSHQNKDKEVITEWFKQTAEMVDKGHANFWKKRGLSKPPSVSPKKLYIFDLPHDNA